MSAALAIVPPSPVAFCPAWHARGFEDLLVHGARCCWCVRDVAAPDWAKGLTVGCIYCAMDRGDLPAVEIEP